jgi:hypothetical protein
MNRLRWFGHPVHRRCCAWILAALVVFFCICLTDASDGTACSAELAKCQARNCQLELVTANTCAQLSATASSRSSAPLQHPGASVARGTDSRGYALLLLLLSVPESRDPRADAARPYFLL